MSKFKWVTILLLLTLCFCGCAQNNHLPSTPQPSAQTIAATSTLELLPTNTPISLPTPTPQPQPTKTEVPFIPIKGTISVENFKLRKGPGFFFDTVNLYDQNDVVQVFGQTPGGDWLFVSTEDSRSGWMKSEYITLYDDVSKVPVFGFNNGDLIFGHVKNSLGQPMTHVGIVIFPAVTDDSSLQDVAVTDDTGTFYLYLPSNLQGDYTIGVNAYDCGSNAVDSQCQFLYGFPSAQSISVPHQSDISIEFVLPNL